MTHSLISPSESHIWRYCTGYPGMKLLYPKEKSSPAAQVGSQKHQAAAALIHNNEFTGHTYADDVILNFSARETCFKGVEVRLKAPAIHPQSYGTCDAYIKFTRRKHIIVWDYKTGHIPVEAIENWQLINYAAALFEPGYTVDLKIIQNDKIRTWSPDSIEPYISELSHAAHEVYSSNARLRTGAHCRYCIARHDCAPARQAALQLFEATGRPLPANRSIETIAEELLLLKRAIESLETIKTAYEDKINRAITAGVNVPGWKLAPGRGKLTWNRPDDEIISMGAMFNIDLRKSGVITPTQAKAAGLDSNIVDIYAKINKGGLKLTPDNDAKEVFKT